MAHLLGESCGALTIEESFDLLRAKEKVISDLEKKVCELESELSNEKEKHANYETETFVLLRDKEVIIKKMEELEKRPTQERVNDLMKKLKMLEVEILEKRNQLEKAEEKIAELSTKVEKPDNNQIPIFKRFFSLRAQEAGTSKSKISKGHDTSNNTTPLTPVVPVTPMVPTGRKLVVFREGNGLNFGLEDLLRASAEVMGKGTFGSTYKAITKLGKVVVVKRLKEVNVPEKEFRENVTMVGKLEHRNIVPLLAYYYSKDENLLLYDFMAMGSLSASLHGSRYSDRTRLDWKARAKIALAVSQGVHHIHSGGPTSSHGNIKSSNVLLTTNYEARLSDHSLYTLANPQAPFTRVTGNHAPEATDPKKISHKADVYSFGVLVLELLTGKAPAHAVLYENGRADLPRWVNSELKKERAEEVFDVDLVRSQSCRDDMMQLLQVALKCTEQYPDRRPNMAEVVMRIEEIVKNKY